MNYEPLDLESTDNIKIKSNKMVPLIHSFGTRNIDYNMSKVDLRMYVRNAPAKQCDCTGPTGVFK